MLDGPYLPPEAVADIGKYCDDRLHGTMKDTFLILVRKLVDTAERDAKLLATTIKAKQENDERFMRERDDARYERDVLKSELAAVREELEEWRAEKPARKKSGRKS